MPKPSSSNEKNVPSFDPPHHRPRWVAASSCLLIGLLILVALGFYDFHQSSQSGTGYIIYNRHNPNPVGWVGAEFIWWSLNLVGISTVLFPVFLFWMSFVALRNAKQLATTRIVAMGICIITACALAAMAGFDVNADYFTGKLGGRIGTLIYDDMFKDTLGGFGSLLLLGVVYCLGLMFIFTKDITAEFEKLVQVFQQWRDQRAQRKVEAVELRQQAKEAEPKSKIEPLATPVAATVAVPALAKKLTLPLTGFTTAPFAQKPETATADPKLAPVKSGAKAGSTATDTKSLEVEASGKLAFNIVKPEETRKAKITPPQSDDDTYKFPSLDLLMEQVRPAADSEDEYNKNMIDLVRILGEFDVTVTAGDIRRGPVITRYEVRPAAGVRVEKISGLDKNIALGMKAQSVRILAPIPGKDAVGVEVPNQKATPVGLREIIESVDWADAKAELPIALGKDVSGKPLISDLAKMPHLLIAGATGSGKSVCINAIIASILYSKSPKDVKLIMVDPKVVELKIFNTLPHMMIEVVTEPKKVPAALKILLKEMEKRYQQFAKANVRNILGYNARNKNPSPPPDAQQTLAGLDPPAADNGLELPDRLPYIIAIIDELADLMMVAPAEIETSIARLAQLARAAGIHLIIATQRPSVNVITGVIKANLPSRIAFQVASQVDSRVILDGKGAETLIGRGDMLFSPPGSSRLVRAQGAFVSDEEVLNIVESLKKENGPPKYDQSIQEQIDRDAAKDEEEGEGDGSDDEMGDDEELFQQALDVLRSTKRASTSMIQRRLRIGYNRAARIMDLMEDKGIIGPENGSSPREILKDLDAL